MNFPDPCQRYTGASSSEITPSHARLWLKWPCYMQTCMSYRLLHLFSERYGTVDKTRETSSCKASQCPVYKKVDNRWWVIWMPLPVTRHNSLSKVSKILDISRRCSPSSPSQDSSFTRDSSAVLRILRCCPATAFSKRDTAFSPSSKHGRWRILHSMELYRRMSAIQLARLHAIYTSPAYGEAMARQ